MSGYTATSSSNKYVKATQKALTLLNINNKSHHHRHHLTISQLNQLQSHLIITGAIKDPFASAKLLSNLTTTSNNNNKNLNLSQAHKLFLHLQHKSIFIWNTIIKAFLENHQPNTALSLYKHMLQCNFRPNNYTFSFVIKGCTFINDLNLGSCCHAQVVKFGWEYYDFVVNGLVHFYASCGLMDRARKLFDLCCDRDVITWTALINGYVKAGDIVLARQLFDQMPEKNSVSWSAMISGYVQVGLFKEALKFFHLMQVSGFRPNHGSIVCMLAACASLGGLDEGMWIHAYVKKNEVEVDRRLGAALIDMYAKCGCIEIACSVFNEMADRDVYAYSCLISGLANHGQSEAAIELFNRMQNEGMVPNGVTFVCVLNACSRMGLVDEGLRIFKSMSEVYGVEPGVEHYGCLVDLLGRAGKLKEATKVVRDMPMEPDKYVLGALLNACRVHGNVELGKETVESLVQQSLDHGGVHVVLSNMYASANKWDDVTKTRKGMIDKNVRKVPGCSVVGVDETVCEFAAV